MALSSPIGRCHSVEVLESGTIILEKNGDVNEAEGEGGSPGQRFVLAPVGEKEYEGMLEEGRVK